MIPPAFSSAKATSTPDPPLVPRHRDQEHHRDDRQILEDQDADREASRGCLRFPPFTQDLQHDRGRGERDEEAAEDADTPLHAEGQEAQRHADRREKHLDPTPAEYEALDASQALEAELDPDGEEQEDNAQLGDGVHELRVRHDPRGVGADDDTRHEEPYDGQQPNPVARIGDQCAHHDQHGHFPEELGGWTSLHCQSHRRCIQIK